MVSRWKEEFLKHSSEVFSTKSSVKEENVDTNELYSKIGRLEIELEWLKKSQNNWDYERKNINYIEHRTAKYKQTM